MQMWEFTKYMFTIPIHPHPLIDYCYKLARWNPMAMDTLVEDHGLQDFYNPEDGVLLYTQPVWTSFSPIIGVILISLFLLILGLTLPQKAYFIQFLNYVAGLYVFLLLLVTPVNNMNLQYTDTSEYYFYMDDHHDKIEETLNKLFNIEAIYGIDSSTFNWYPTGSYYANFFFILASITVICFLWGISDKFYTVENNKLEFLLLVIFIYISAIILINSIDFMCALILLECIAFSSYILVGFERKNKFSSSSGIKYLILGSVPGGFFVLGVTLLYKNYGSFFLQNLEVLATSEYAILDWTRCEYGFIKDESYEYDYIYTSTYIAILFILGNLLFKLTAAPLHMWAPSVYGGAPLATTTFLSIFSKLTIICFSVYLYTTVFYLFNDIISYILIISGILSIIAGILGAFSEKLIKRFFVYSSMGHVGFMLLGLGVINTLTKFNSSNLNGVNSYDSDSPNFTSPVNHITKEFNEFDIEIQNALIDYPLPDAAPFTISPLQKPYTNTMELVVDNIPLIDMQLRSTINYLIVYIISAYILWFILMYLTKKTVYLTNLKTLCINHPVLSFILSITMFSLSGIPPLAGFFVKFEIFHRILDSGYYSVVLFLFILSVFSFFYYLRIIKIIYFENSKTLTKNKNVDLMKLRLLSVLINIIIFFVLFVPEPFLYIIEKVILWLVEFR